ncbi:MAG: ABC-2 transporter permease [Butyricicoccus pullicaecorum]|nr:ABC-2 transporter permease [Butyricicoccus pullicaecorum]
MLASLKSDYYLLRGYFKTLLGVYAFMIVISVIQGNAYMANFYPAFLAIYMPYTLFSLSQQSGWETMLLSAPVSRGGLVGGRYAMCLAVDGVMLLISFAVSCFIEPDAVLENVCSVLFTLTLVLALNAVLLPIIYKFGVNRARFVFMAVCLVPALALPLSDVIDCLPLANAFSRIIRSVPALLGVCACAFALLGLSYWISYAIYRRKEF